MILKAIIFIFAMFDYCNSASTLRRTPKVYNALITTDDNLAPSRSFPVIQPTLHETGIAHLPFGPYNPYSFFGPPLIRNFAPHDGFRIQQPQLQQEFPPQFLTPEEEPFNQQPSQGLEHPLPIDYSIPPNDLERQNNQRQKQQPHKKLNEQNQPPATPTTKQDHLLFSPTAQGQIPFQSGQPLSFQQGQPPFQQGQAPFQQGQPSFQQGLSFQQGAPTFQQGPPSFPQQSPLYNQQSPLFHQQSPSFPQQSPSFPQQPLNGFGLPPNLVPLQQQQEIPFNLQPFNYNNNNNNYPLIFDGSFSQQQPSQYPLPQQQLLPHYGYFPQHSFGVKQAQKPNKKRRPSSSTTSLPTKKTSRPENAKELNVESKEPRLVPEDLEPKPLNSLGSVINQSENKNSDVPDVPPPPIPSGAKVSNNFEK